MCPKSSNSKGEANESVGKGKGCSELNPGLRLLALAFRLLAMSLALALKLPALLTSLVESGVLQLPHFSA